MPCLLIRSKRNKRIRSLGHIVHTYYEINETRSACLQNFNRPSIALLLFITGQVLACEHLQCTIVTASIMGQISPSETSTLMQALATQAPGTGPAHSVHLLVRRAMRWKGSDRAKRFMILDSPSILFNAPAFNSATMNAPPTTRTRTATPSYEPE